MIMRLSQLMSGAVPRKPSQFTSDSCDLCGKRIPRSNLRPQGSDVVNEAYGILGATKPCGHQCDVESGRRPAKDYPQLNVSPRFTLIRRYVLFHFNDRYCERSFVVCAASAEPQRWSFGGAATNIKLIVSRRACENH